MTPFDNMLEYTRDLDANNNRAWFHDNHRQYEQARDDFYMVLDVMKFVLAKNAPELGDMIMFNEPKSFMYRIPRDMRYSREQTPYNPAFRAYLSPNKKDFLPLAYYLHISYLGCYLDCGVWPYERDQLNRLREYLAVNYEELDMIAAENRLDIYGEQLKRVPRGYEQDHPAAKWLKYKYMLTEYAFKPSELASLDAFSDAAGAAVARFEPFRKYLTAAYT